MHQYMYMYVLYMCMYNIPMDNACVYTMVLFIHFLFWIRATQEVLLSTCTCTLYLVNIPYMCALLSQCPVLYCRKDITFVLSVEEHLRNLAEAALKV